MNRIACRHGVTTILFFLLALTAVRVEGAPSLPTALVKTAPVAEKNMSENAKFIGVIYFYTTGEVSPETSGLVEAAAFSEGDRVKKDDVLVRLNTDFLEKDIALVKARIRQVEVSIAKTRKNLGRYEKLYQQQAASEVAYDDLKFDLQALRRKRETLRQELARVELEKEKMVVTAPFDGLILSKGIEPGAWISPGAAVCRIGSSDEVYVRVAVGEELMRYIHKGDKTDVLINAYDHKLQGIIEGVIPVADEKTKNISVKIRLGALSDLPEGVAENMSAAVYIPTDQPQKMRLFPRDALIKFQGRDFIYSIKEGKAAIMPVSIDGYFGDQVGTLTPHIQPGMPVIVDGNERLQPGQPVMTAGQAAGQPSESPGN